MSNNSGLAVNGTASGNSTMQYEDLTTEEYSPGVAIFLMYMLLLIIMSTQTALFVWKKKHKRSYELATLFGLWIVPAVISMRLHFWRFLGVWAAFTSITGYFIWLVMGGRADHTTPRKVYTWFLGVYKVSRGVGIAGYILLLLEMFGAGMALAVIMPPGTSLMLLWYGLYFGVLGRDCAEVASDQMALILGTGRMSGRLASSVNACGMCGGELKDFSHMGEQAAAGGVERCVQLSCKHCFHELCIHGWTMVGKKDVCPVCSEKVDLRGLYADRPWETQNLNWIQMLDALRYCIVWNPIIFAAFSVLAHMFPHHTVHRHIAAAALGAQHRAGLHSGSGAPPPGWGPPPGVPPH